MRAQSSLLFSVVYVLSCYKGGERDDKVVQRDVQKLWMHIGKVSRQYLQYHGLLIQLSSNTSQQFICTDFAFFSRGVVLLSPSPSIQVENAL